MSVKYETEDIDKFEYVEFDGDIRFLPALNRSAPTNLVQKIVWTFEIWANCMDKLKFGAEFNSKILN